MRGFNSDLTADTNRSLANSSTQSPSPPQPPPVVRYKECQKNHAANTGGHVTDGCGEFMPSGNEGTAESLKCAACDCHRSFHRREAEGDSVTPSGTVTASHYPWGNVGRFVPPLPQPLPRPAPQQGQTRVATQPVMMTFGGGAMAESSSEDLNLIHANHTSTSKKRFRTKFTEDQKERMQEFAERIGWRIQKQNENEVQQFCTESGVKRQVFKVWMHNCKQASKKKQL